MSLLDNVPEDTNPLVITLDFNLFQDGAKYSTLFRANFDRFKVQLGLSDDDFAGYVASQLLERLKYIMKEDARDAMAVDMAALMQAQIPSTIIDGLDIVRK